MTDVPQGGGQSTSVREVFDKLVDRLPAFNEDRAFLVFIASLSAMAFGTLASGPVQQGWIVYITFATAILSVVSFKVVTWLLGRGASATGPKDSTRTGD
jgi:hypothetical protein